MPGSISSEPYASMSVFLGSLSPEKLIRNEQFTHSSTIMQPKMNIYVFCSVLFMHARISICIKYGWQSFMCTKMYNELLREFRKIENYKEFEKQLKERIK